jgi:hypothetical protein
MSSIFDYYGGNRRRAPVSPWSDELESELGGDQPNDQSQSIHSPSSVRVIGAARGVSLPPDHPVRDQISKDVQTPSLRPNLNDVEDRVDSGQPGRSSVFDYTGAGGGRPYPNDVDARTTGNTAIDSIHSPADLSGGATGGTSTPLSPGATQRGGKSVWDYYGVRPPQLQPLPEPDLADRMGYSKGYHLQSSRAAAMNQAEVQRADTELKAAQSAEDARRQPHWGRTFDDSRIDPTTGKPHRISIFQPYSPDQNAHITDLGEAVPKEAPAKDAKYSRSVEVINGKPTVVWRNDNDPKDVFTGGGAAPKEFAPERGGIWAPAGITYDASGRPVFATVNRRTGDVSQATGDEPAGPRPGSGARAGNRDDEGVAIRQFMNRAMVPDEAENPRGPKHFDENLFNSLIATYRSQRGPVRPPASGMGDAQAADRASRTAGPQAGNVRPDALPQQEFVQAFQQKRGRAPSADELRRATAQGYVR